MFFRTLPYWAWHLKIRVVITLDGFWPSWWRVLITVGVRMTLKVQLQRIKHILAFSWSFLKIQLRYEKSPMSMTVTYVPEGVRVGMILKNHVLEVFWSFVKIWRRFEDLKRVWNILNWMVRFCNPCFHYSTTRYTQNCFPQTQTWPHKYLSVPFGWPLEKNSFVVIPWGNLFGVVIPQLELPHLVWPLFGRPILGCPHGQ